MSPLPPPGRKRDGHVPETANARLVRLNQRLRQAFIEGAEEESRQRLGRGPTDLCAITWLDRLQPADQ